ncbi:uncharacterized protein LOC118427111 [Branchiostoma floridae]|uniref:Uncharacterized protein LOC118427111 n=1 Tax=Branchiostoma floridae TaxID=7739 RepID=A0A9J7M224_BRAFL|nr:uncharacterized protein LOC118427111 [Branchiostoma floridae]
MYYHFPMDERVAGGIAGRYVHGPLTVFGDVNLVKGWENSAASFRIGQGRMESERGSTMSQCIASETFCDSGYSTYFWFNPGKTSSFSTVPGDGIDLLGIGLDNNAAHPGFLFTTPSASRKTFRLEMTVNHTMYQAFVTLPGDWWSHISFGRTGNGKAVIGVNGIEMADVTSTSVGEVNVETDSWLFIGPTGEQPISSTVGFDQIIFYERWIPPEHLLSEIEHKLEIEQPNKSHQNGDLTCRAIGNVTTTTDGQHMLGTTGYLNCGNKYMSCVGSTVYCARGFSLVFWLKVQCDGDASSRTIISNMGQWSPVTSRGVRLVYQPGRQELVLTMASREGNVYEAKANMTLGTWTEIRVVGSDEGATLIVGSIEAAGVEIASFGQLTYDMETTLMIGRDERECPVSDYVSFNGICYKHFAEEKTYAEARQTCASDDGLLAMPKDSASNAFIFNLGGENHWLGFTDVDTEGQWVFEDGQTLASSGYTNWKVNEPNDLGAEDCAQFIPPSDEWNDVPCDRTFGFVCQISGCQNGYSYFSHTGRCYRAYDTEKTFDEALATCEAEAGTLAMPRDDITNDFLVALKNTVNVDLGFYFGLDHRGGAWTYVDGGALGYTNWGAGEPNGGSEECGGFFPATFSTTHLRDKWNDGPCSGKHGFICESVKGAELVGLWPLNVESGASDVTGNGNDAVARGTLLSPGPFGDTDGAFLFSGTVGSYLDIPNNGRLDVRYSHTVLAHIYPTGAAGPIFAYITNGNDWGVHFFQTGPQELTHRVVGRNRNNDSPFLIANVLNQNTWNYVGGSYNSVTGMASVWNNAQLVNEIYAGVAEVKTQYPIRVAMKDGDSRIFAGRIACLQLYNYAMTPGQIEAARYKCKTSVVPRRVGFWPLNAEHLADDISGGGNHGVAVGTTLTEGPNGEAQSAFSFAGNSQSYIEIPNNGELDVKRSFTVLLFAYHLGGSSMLDYRSPGLGTHIWIWPDRQLYVYANKYVP